MSVSQSHPSAETGPYPSSLNGCSPMEALVWIYRNGFRHSSECPEFVKAAFNDAFEPIRQAARLEAANTAVLREQLRSSLLLGVLKETRRLVSEASSSGFVDEAAVTALFVNNGAITRAIATAEAAQ